MVQSQKTNRSKSEVAEQVTSNPGDAQYLPHQLVRQLHTRLLSIIMHRIQSFHWREPGIIWVLIQQFAQLSYTVVPSAVSSFAI